MANTNNDERDSQILSENVAFLDDCFDNTFALQSSLVAVKEYVADVSTDFLNEKKNHVHKNINSSVKSMSLEAADFKNNSAVLQCSTDIMITNKNLKDWGLPFEIASKYEQRGITAMFDWQVTCLANPKVLLECCNLVYSAPTSAGKTLVAEILTIKTVLERQKKVIIILPFVSIVREKMFYLQDILSSSGIRVEGFMGAQSPPGGLQAVHVAICTIEKANSLVNKLLDEGNISELGAVIVDELHLLGDPNRGYILELLLTKIKYITLKLDNVQIQIVGMSATLPNLEVLAHWLNAELFVTQFRPIPLDEFCLVGKKLYNKQGSANTMPDMKIGNEECDHVLNICLGTIKEGCSVLIFCMTKSRCENLALNIASTFYKLGCEGGEIGMVLRDQLKTESITEVLEQLKNCPVGLDNVLQRTISFGVTYHHAGLTFDERDIIEGGFKSGAIRVLVATSTLSSGVNLPARKVIIRSPLFQRQPINILTYKQMVGRAGRMGRDTKGESILICTEAEKKVGFELMMGTLDPVNSCIESEDKYMRAMLEMIASQVVCTKAEIDLYAKCTLLFTQQAITLSQNILLENTLKELKNFELIRIQIDGDEKHYVATPLGKACLSSSMAPNDGLSLFCELQKARQCLVLETDLHLIYLVTPYSVSGQWGNIDWLHLLTLWESLTKAMKRVGELVGVQESFIIHSLRGNNKSNNVQNKLNVHKRFYTALALQDLVNEVPLSEVAAKFQCARGFLQSLQQAAATFAGMVTAFCRQLGWKNMEMLISQFQDRLHFGIHSELLELMKLPTLNGLRARTLFDAGFETISSIATSDASVIENILHKAVPFQSEKEREDDDGNDIRKRNKIKHIWITGSCGVTAKEAANNLILEARKHLEHEIGVTNIKWGNKDIINSKDVDSCTTYKSPLALEHGDSTKNELYAGVVLREKSQKEIAPNGVVDINNFDRSFNGAKGRTEICTDELQKSNCVDKNNILELRSLEICSKSISNEEIHDKCISQRVPNTTAKDEIIWDSLNITANALDNITKLSTNNNAFSPNISFGDTEDKYTPIVDVSVHASSTSSKYTSVKDVSLFSSDGDNSSLFDESLPLDLISSKLLDNRTVPVVCKQDTTDYGSIDSDSILNAFKSTLIDIDDDEDIKLVYEDDNKLSENELDSNINVLNVGTDNTPVVNELVSISNFKSPLKRKGKEAYLPIAKKKKTDNELTQQYNAKFNGLMIQMNCSQSIMFTIHYNRLINCYVLRDNDIIDNLHVIETVSEASIFLHLKNSTSNEVIGSNILNLPKHHKTSYFEDTVQGIAVYFKQSICLFLDLTTLAEKSLNLTKERLKFWFRRQDLKLILMSVKSYYLYIKKWLGVSLASKCVDISISQWLADSDGNPNIINLIKNYCRVDFNEPIKIDNKPKKFEAFNIFEDICVRAAFISLVAESQGINLSRQYQFIHQCIAVETQVSKILADCEFYGISVDKDLASRLLIDVKNSQDVLQKKAYKLCGYHFNFNSSKDVAKVLGIYNGRRVSTKKSVLSTHNSPMSSIVMYWRKLNAILTKILYPLTEKACIYSEGDRISPSYTTYTCTGRISMHAPNLQSMPRTFSIPAHYLTLNDNKPCDDVIEFNCRNIFKVTGGYVMVSADYCQLEMRILTHYSRDPVLTSIMRSDVDVFKSIAASWGGVPEEQVVDDLRQKAKQLCYGILYGMGNKTLSQQLDVTEMEAAVFMDTFYKTYPAVKAFTTSVIDECRKKGYVETLKKRRRYLPDINSSVVSKKNAAERQAVNTTIQGSAADIAKVAMCALHTKTDTYEPKPRLILQMHDELIYEVAERHKEAFVVLLKEAMEGAVRLNVPLPVKVKSGRSWGTLKELHC